MRISDSSPTPNTRQTGESSRLQGAVSIYRSADSKSEGLDSSSSDLVHLSGISKVLQAGASRRAEQIANLTLSVRSGKYEVPASELSRAMVDETIASTGGEK